MVLWILVYKELFIRKLRHNNLCDNLRASFYYWRTIGTLYYKNRLHMKRVLCTAGVVLYYREKNNYQRQFFNIFVGDILFSWLFFISMKIECKVYSVA